MKFFCCLRYSSLISLTVVFLFSCSGKTENRNFASETSVTSTPEKSVAHTKNAKPSASVKLASTNIISVEQNQLTNTEILLETAESFGELQVELNPSEGLDLTNTMVHQVIKLPTSSPLKIPVAFKAAANGRYYLNIRVNLSNGDSISTRNFAVIVQVGDQLDVSSSELKQLKKAVGENVISLPAQESISSQ